MSYYFHFYLLFPSDEPWFVPEGINYAHFAGAIRGYYTVWQNMEIYLPDSRILQGLATNFEAERLSQLTSRSTKLHD